MSTPPRHVLVFDSGIGGLGVVDALRQISTTTALQIDYLADNAVFPYGEQPDDLLLPRIEGLIISAIAETRPEAVIIACNTASTLALDRLRETSDVPFIGCVPPVRWAARETRSGVFAILATAATARRPYLAELKNRFAAEQDMIIHGGRTLADLAERAFLGEALPLDLLRTELELVFAAPRGNDVDVVGLGCTHYTFLRQALVNIAPSRIKFLDPAEAVARQALKIIAETAPAPGLAISETDAGLTGQMWMTAPPKDHARLELAINRFGYQGLTIRDFSDR